MKRRLFIIGNPTHLTNARKYIENHPDGINDFILTFNYQNKYKSQIIEEVKNTPDFNLVKIILMDDSSNKISVLLNMLSISLQIRKLKSKLKKYDEILYTMYHLWVHNYILSLSKASKIIYISDGAAIFNVVEQRKKNKYFDTGLSHIYSKFYKLLDIKPIDNLHYFSPVQLNVAPYDSYETFSYDKNRDYQIAKNKIYFVGQPLVELGFLKKESLFKYLQKIKEKNPEARLIYYPHRYEKMENLKNTPYIDQIVESGKPFEESLKKQKELPAKIISFYSSVLINLPHLYPDIIFNYIKLDESILTTSTENINKIKKVYNNFEQLQKPNLQVLLM